MRRYGERYPIMSCAVLGKATGLSLPCLLQCDYFITSACAYVCAYNFICVFIHIYHSSSFWLLLFAWHTYHRSIFCICALCLTSMLWGHFTFPSLEPSMQPSVAICSANHILVGLVTSLLSGSICCSITWVPSKSAAMVAISSINSVSHALARHPSPSCVWPLPKPSPMKWYECHNAELRSIGLDEGGHT